MPNIRLSKPADYKNPSYRRSDHPSFGEKKHSLIIDSQGASNKEIQTESGTLRFENGVAVLPDDSRSKDVYDELKAIKSLHPNQYSLVQDKPTVNADSIHRYHFSTLPMPWAKYDDLGRRIWEDDGGASKTTIQEKANGKSVESRTRSRGSKRGAG